MSFITPVTPKGEETDVSHWLHHPVTQAAAHDARQKVKSQLATLLSACAESSDPNVMRHYARYTAYQSMHETLTGKQHDPSRDNDDP